MKRLTALILSTTLFLTACGGGGGGGITPPPPSSEWPTFQTLSASLSPNGIEGGQVTLSMDTPAPAGYRWVLPVLNPPAMAINLEALNGDQPGASATNYLVKKALTGVRDYTFGGFVRLLRISDGEAQLYNNLAVSGKLSGTVPYTLYPEAYASSSEIEREVLRLVNVERANGTGCRGVTDEAFPPAAPLEWSENLARAGRQHAADMVKKGYMGHESPEGMSVTGVLALLGVPTYNDIADNLGSGYLTARAVVDGWLNSPGHCRHMMRSDAKYAGVGRVVAPDLTGDKWALVITRQTR